MSASSTSAVACASGSARWHGCHRRPEEVGELREARARDAAREHAPRERDGVDHRRRDARACEPLRLAVEEREVEARVVRGEHRVAREGEEPPHGHRRMRRAAELPVGDAGDRGDGRAQRLARIDERLELLDDLEPDDLHGADLADLRGAWTKAGRLEVDDDVRRVLEEEPGAERRCEGNRIAVPREPSIRLDDLREERTCQRDRRLPKREEPARRFLGDDRASAFLDELHEAVGCV